MKIKACLQNKSDIWKTPKFIYEYFEKHNYFDPCPINPDFDGLNIDWKKLNFVNPPYSKIKLWIEKSIFEKRKGNKIVLLLPARPDTKWFSLLYEELADIIFIKGRLKFSESNSAPFPSMLVFLHNQTHGNITLLSQDKIKEGLL